MCKHKILFTPTFGINCRGLVTPSNKPNLELTQSLEKLGQTA